MRRRIPGADLFTFLGPWWLTLIGVVVIAGMVIFVGIGAVLDYRDWRRRPRRVKKNK